MTYNGGAVYVSSSSTTNNGNSFVNNRASSIGGAIYVSGNSVNNGNNFYNNIANNAGGAIYASGSITDTGNAFSSNRANNNGGALYVSGSSIVTDGSKFINNRARNGGGGALYVPNYSGVSVTTSNCTFVNNIGYAMGGALSVLGSRAVLRVNGSTFVNNLITGSNGNVASPPDPLPTFQCCAQKRGKAWYAKSRDGERRRLAGQRSTDFAAIQLTINDRYDYIAVIRVKGDPLRAQKVRSELVRIA